MENDDFCNFFRKSRKKVIFAALNQQVMSTFYNKNKQIIDNVIVALFWMVLTILFLRLAVLRPYCVQHPYKELLCVVFIAMLWGTVRRVAYPILYRHDRRKTFWLASAVLVLLSAEAEVRLVSDDIFASFPQLANIDGYRATLFFSILLRNAGIIGCLLLAFFLSLNHSKHSESLSSDENAPLHHAHSLDNREVPDASDNAEGNGVFDANTEANVPAEALPGLDSRLLSILEVVEHHPGCSIQFIASQFPVRTSNRTIERCIAALKKQGLVERIGSKKKGGYYLIVPPQEGVGVESESLQMQTNLEKPEHGRPQTVQKKALTLW